MHQFLRSVGFSEINRNRLEEIIRDIIAHPQTVHSVKDASGEEFAEISAEAAPHMGIALRGFYDEADEFHYEYYYPYFVSQQITTKEDIGIERHADREEYAGLCDDMRIGITLVFYVQNVADYLAVGNTLQADQLPRGAALSGLSAEGKILLPTGRPLQERNSEKISEERARLQEQAMGGDEDAMITLSINEFDEYSKTALRIQNEDLYSIVNSSLMPYGIESDQYRILGEILQLSQVKNRYTGETVYCMKLRCNGLEFPVCINEADLTGVPAVGRRFRGTIWLQGTVDI